jgi:hypothetical protein
MTQGTFEDGYLAGWQGVAGLEPIPSHPTFPGPNESRDYVTGHKYGRADALGRSNPGTVA